MGQAKCPACGEGRVEPAKRAGRRLTHRNLPDVELPAGLAIPTCTACGEEWFDAKTTEAVQRAVEEAYAAELGAMADRAIRGLAEAIPQRELERLVGVSAGYFSKLKGGKEPSAALVALLALLASDPSRVDELRALWRRRGTSSMPAPVVGRPKIRRDGVKVPAAPAAPLPALPRAADDVPLDFAA